MVFKKICGSQGTHTHTHTHTHTQTHTHTSSTVRGWTVPPCFSQTLLHAGPTRASSLYISISKTRARTQPHKRTHTSLFHSVVVINPFLFSSLITVYHCCVCVCVCVCGTDHWDAFCAVVIYLTTAPRFYVFSLSHYSSSILWTRDA